MAAKSATTETSENLALSESKHVIRCKIINESRNQWRKREENEKISEIKMKRGESYQSM